MTKLTAGPAAMLACLATALAATVAHAADGVAAEPLSVVQTLPGPEGVTAVKLSNEMTVIVKVLPTAPVVCVQAYVRAGGLYEGPWLGCGLSHLVEHLVAEGAVHENAGPGAQAAPGAPAQADSAPADDAHDRVQLIGGQSNASTSQDHTTYYISASSAKANECIDLVADWMARPHIRPEDFAREHGVVQRELELGKDSPQRQLYQAHAANIYGSHPAGVPVIGYAQPLAGLKLQDVLDYHARMYVPQNMVFVVVGDVDPQAVIQRACKALAGMPTGRTPDLTLPDVAPLAGVRRMVVPNSEVKEVSEAIGFVTIPLVHADLYALDLLSDILTAGDSSRLDRTIYRQKKLVTSVSSSSYTPPWGKGDFVISFRAAPALADKAEAAILDELKTIIEKGVTPEELTAAKRHKTAEQVFSQQTAEAQAGQIGSDYLLCGDMDFSANYTQRIQSVTAEQVHQAAAKYFTFDAMAITRQEPAQAAATTTAPATQAAKPAGEARLITLPNGLRVVLFPTKAVGLVAMTLATEGGLLLETDKTNGMGAVMASLSTKGAGDMSAEQIAEFFDQAGGGIDGICGNNTFVWQASCLDDSFAKALEILSQVVIKPTFPASELDIIRDPMLKAIDRVDQDLLGQASKIAKRIFFANSPYRMLASGSKDVVQAATVEQVREYHAKCVRAGSSVLAIYGRFDADAAAKQVAALFAAMPSGKVELTLPPPPKVAPGTQPAGETTIAKMEVVQTTKKGAAVVVYHPGMTIGNLADRLPINVLDTIISGYQLPAGWLHNELRQKQLVYVVHASNWPGLAPGAFMTYAACQPDKAPEVVEIITRDLKRAADCRPTRDEMDRAINTIVTADVLGSQSMSELSMAAALNELYGLGYDYLHRMEQGYRKLTPDDVQRVARKYLSGGGLIVVTTPRPELFPQAASRPAK